MTHTYRRATPDDNRCLFEVSELALADLARRKGYPWDEVTDDEALWAQRRPLYEHLAVAAEQCWLAEDEAGQVIGYARSVRQDGVLELTELFVRPGQQSAGVGRELLARAFSTEGRQRYIVATSDTRALARYLKAGLSVHFPIFEFRGTPEAVTVPTDLRLEPMGADAVELAAGVDRAVLGYRRDADHAWLAQTREGFLARRDRDVVGYVYCGEDSGPIAALAAEDLPALLAHAETFAHARGAANLSFEVPLVNRQAVAHLLARGYQMQSFFAFLMSDGPVGHFENYVLFSPPYFI
jgi:ribosomal protein S18 acetylase RimI-like enzyme